MGDVDLSDFRLISGLSGLSGFGSIRFHVKAGSEPKEELHPISGNALQGDALDEAS
jgi:hypothetical protein